MAVFEYEGIREGRKVKGTVEARSKFEALSRIRSEGIVPLSLEEKRERFRIGSFRKVSEEELATVLFQIQVLLEAGLPLTDAVDLVSRQVRNDRLSSALSGVKADLERGESVSSAFRRAGVFPEFLPEMLMAAETGENLEVVFRMASDHLRTVADLKGRVVNTLLYPAVVIAMSLIALFVAVRFVVPRIAGVLEGFGRELPLATEVVLILSDIITYCAYALLLITAGMFFLRGRVLTRERVERLLLRAPVIGSVILYFDLSRFAYTLYMTLSSAVPLVTAFNVATASLSVKVLRDKVSELTKDLERGKPLHWVLKKAGFFPHLFISLVETGERSGELERMLKVLGDVYRNEAVRVINLWVRMVEPVSILVIGLLVGLIVLSVILPLTEISSGMVR